MLKKLIRKPYRELLKNLTKKALEKHEPRVVAVVGDGQTSIARELIYEILKKKYPVRRNLESFEAEFSVPLTVLGYKGYPKNIFEWLWLPIRVFASLNISKPYKHFLVLELNFMNEEILGYWLDVLAPEVLLIVGRIPIDYTEYEFKKVVKITSNQTENLIGTAKVALLQLGRYFEVSQDEMDKVIETFTLPTSKIRFFPGKNGSFIIDATQHSFPITIDSVLDLVDNEAETKVVFTNIKKDIKRLSKQKGWKINPKNYSPQTNDLIILRGKRSEIQHNFEKYFADHSPLI